MEGMTTTPTLSAQDGTTIPAIGFGTYRLRGSGGAETVVRAIEAGYRLVDSAFSYENEGAVGAAVRSAAVPRDDVLVTSKLPGRYHAYDDAVRTVEESLFRTGLDRIDLYLIHWPNPRVGLYVEAYEALVECRDRGLVRHVGVSNFLPEHLDAVIAATGATPPSRRWPRPTASPPSRRSCAGTCSSASCRCPRRRRRSASARTSTSSRSSSRPTR